MILINYKNNELLSIREQSSHDFETYPGEPIRVFTSFRTYPTHLASSTRSFSNLGLFKLDYHLDRLLKSAEDLGVCHPGVDGPWLQEQIITQLKSFVDKGNRVQSSVRVRVVLEASGLSLFLAWYTPPWPEETSINCISFKGERPMAQHKTSEFGVSFEARKQAHRQHAQEALFVSDQGFVTEGAWSNVFWVSADGAICTSRTGVLPGVSRRLIIEREPVIFREITLPQLLKAEEVFITQATTGVSAVKSIDGVELRSPSPGPETAKIRARYNHWIEQERK